MAYPDSVNVQIDLANGPYVNSFTWTDVSQYVCGPVQFQWGRTTGVDDFQPGRGSLLLDNRDSRFDPSNSSGPYYGQLKQRRRIRVTAMNNGTLRQFIFGWIQGFTQRVTPRGWQQTEIQFVDALGLLAQQPLPLSVWDWQVGTKMKSSLVAWYKLDPDYWDEVDFSGNLRDGTWRVFEGNNIVPWNANLIPDAILQSSKAGSVIPSAGRNGTNWAPLQSQVGQPLGGISGTPRTPTLCCHEDTRNLPLGDFTAETWIQFRQAFPLQLNNIVASNTPIRQPIFTWGLPGGAQWEFEVDSTGHPAVRVTNLTGSAGALSASATIADASVHHLVFTYTVSTNVVGIWLDGVNLVNVVLTGYPQPFSWPCVVGYAAPDGTSGLQSTLGDVVFYNRLLSSTEIKKNYYAGKYGTIDGTSTSLTTMSAPVQMLQIAGVNLPVSYGAGYGQTIDPGKLGQVDCLQMFRKLGASEQGMLFWEPTYTFWVLRRDWRNTWPDATTSKWTLTDGAVGGGGGGSLTYDTSATVAYDTGQTVTYDGATPTALGFWDTKWISGFDKLTNDVTVRYAIGNQKTGGTRAGEQHVQDAASVADYGTIKTQVDTLLTDSQQALQLGYFRTWLNGNAAALATQSFLDEITVNPNTPAEFDLVLASRMGTRITVTTTRANGSAFTADYHIQRIRHEFNPETGGSWKTTFGLIRADFPAKAFVVGTSALDGPDVIWW